MKYSNHKGSFTLAAVHYAMLHSTQGEKKKITTHQWCCKEQFYSIHVSLLHLSSFRTQPLTKKWSYYANLIAKVEQELHIRHPLQASVGRIHYDYSWIMFGSLFFQDIKFSLSWRNSRLETYTLPTERSPNAFCLPCPLWGRLLGYTGFLAKEKVY